MNIVPPEVWLNIFQYCFQTIKDFKSIKLVHSDWLSLLKLITPTTNLEFLQLLILNLFEKDRSICSVKFYLNEVSIIFLMLKGRVDILEQFNLQNWPLLENRSVFSRISRVCLYFAPDSTFHWFINEHNTLTLKKHKLNISSCSLVEQKHIKKLETKYKISFTANKYLRVLKFFPDAKWLSPIPIKGLNNDTIHSFDEDTRQLYLISEFLKTGEIVLINNMHFLIKLQTPIIFNQKKVKVTNETLAYFFQHEKLFHFLLINTIIPTLMTFDNIELYMKYVAPRKHYWLKPDCVPNGKISLKFCDLLFRQDIVPIDFHQSPHLGDFYSVRDQIPSDFPFGLTCFILTRYGLSSHYNDINMRQLIIEDVYLNNLQNEPKIIDIFQFMFNLFGSHRINNYTHFTKIGCALIFKELVNKWVFNVWCRNELWHFDCQKSSITQIDFWKFLLTLESKGIHLPKSCNKMYSLVRTIQDYNFLLGLCPLEFPIELKHKYVIEKLLAVFIHFDRYDLITDLVCKFHTNHPGHKLSFSEHSLRYCPDESLGKGIIQFCKDLGLEVRY